MSNKDEATREILASELGQLKDKYSQLEQSYNELKRQSSQNLSRGLDQPLGQQDQQLLNVVRLEQARLQNYDHQTS